MTDPTCEWCGHAHAVTALCAQRPKWGRRGFLMMAGAALLGAALPDLPLRAARPAIAYIPRDTLVAGEAFVLSLGSELAQGITAVEWKRMPNDDVVKLLARRGGKGAAR